MPYRVMLVGSPKNDPIFYHRNNGDIAEFETGEEAQRFAKEIAQGGDDRKWRVKRVLDTRWKSREQAKFDNGTYEYVPWEGSSWWEGCRTIHRHHFPHISRSEPGMIAYTESAEKGMDNKQTQIKPGRYLEKYFSEELTRWGISVKRLVQEFEAEYKPRTLHIAETADDIQWVYERGPSSCMSNAAHRKRQGWGYPAPGQWPLDTHACRVYAAGDLAVAYLTENDQPKGPIIARSLVWPKKKTHSRCYGHDAMMKKQLMIHGYRPDPPIGAKLLRMPVKGPHGEDLFLVPYIDVGQQSGAGATAVKDMKDHLKIVLAEKGAYLANCTSGLCSTKLDANLRPRAHNIENCQNCGDHVDDLPDGNLWHVQTSGAGGDVRLWCLECIERDAYQCTWTGHYYTKEGNPPVKMWDGRYWSPRAFRSSGFTCAATKENWPSDQRVRMFDGTAWCLKHFQKNGFTCWWSGEHFPKERMMAVIDGRKVSDLHFAAHCFKCEGCDKNYDKFHKQVGGLCPSCTETTQRGALRLRGYQPSAVYEEYTS